METNRTQKQCDLPIRAASCLDKEIRPKIKINKKRVVESEKKT